MRLFLQNAFFHVTVAFLAGLGIGLGYSWLISPVTYVDANPALLRDDFKEQYRVVIASSYASTHDLARARARLELLSDADPIGELSAQAQRMLGSGEPFERVQLLAKLATDMQQGVVSVPITSTPFTRIVDTPTRESSFVEDANPTTTSEFAELTFAPTSSFELTPLVPQSIFTPTPRPTFTAIPSPGMPFIIVGQDIVCDSSLQPGLLQFTLIDGRRRQLPGSEIIVTWADGEDRFFTGFKPELGIGYADFIMLEDTIYNARVMENGSIVPNLSPPICTDQNGVDYNGGLILTFQQP